MEVEEYGSALLQRIIESRLGGGRIVLLMVSGLLLYRCRPILYGPAVVLAAAIVQSNIEYGSNDCQYAYYHVQDNTPLFALARSGMRVVTHDTRSTFLNGSPVLHRATALI
jgi:hypothetical protein